MLGHHRWEQSGAFKENLRSLSFTRSRSDDVIYPKEQLEECQLEKKTKSQRAVPSVKLTSAASEADDTTARLSL